MRELFFSFTGTASPHSVVIVWDYPISRRPLSHITDELNLIYTAPFV